MIPALKTYIEEGIRLMPVIFISALGGAVACLNTEKQRFSWVFLGIGILTAAFAGILVHCLLVDAPLPEGVKSAAIGISGYASNDVLVLLKKKLLKKVAS